MSNLPILRRAQEHRSSVAFRSETETCSYGQLLARSRQIASRFLVDAPDIEEKRIALLIAPGFDYSAAQWGIWQAGGMVVPLSLSASESEWEYALADSQVSCVLTDAALAHRVDPLCHRLGLESIHVHSISDHRVDALPEIHLQRRAMILYTSGTTNKPKGVVTTHANIQAQIESLIHAWEWTSQDRIPLFLPMHHIHGIINVVACALWSGASIEPFSRFDVDQVLARVRAHAYSLFMAVPTIYVKLIQAIDEASSEDRAAIVDGFRAMRLMVSGSAALPASLHEKWFQWTGQSLLERYGMTEIGMALSNPYRGDRRPGAVGVPLPGVEVRLKSLSENHNHAGNSLTNGDDANGSQSETQQIVDEEDTPGEIQVRGPSVFLEYWNRQEASLASFDGEWFRTGDVAVIEDGYYRIMGRLSSDIIKSGGYKLSALEIESALLEHPRILECAVVGLPDATWGEAVTAVIVLRDPSPFELSDLRAWCKGRMSPYKIPHGMQVVAQLPRNAMGKVTKADIKKLFSVEPSARQP